MAKHMLIDATHPEEIRVVVVDGKRLEEFDIELASKKQLKGNIYLAKVTRVEPSLQAAFVEYGGNRHGFLAFSEIHPDYYRIPVADREALLAEEAREAAAESAREEAREAAADRRRSRSRSAGDEHEHAPDAPESGGASEASEDEAAAGLPENGEEESPQVRSQALDADVDRLVSEESYDAPSDEDGGQDEPEDGSVGVEAGSAAPDTAGGLAAEPVDTDQNGSAAASDDAGDAPEAPAGTVPESVPSDISVEVIGGDESEEEQPRRAPRALRSYKIQEVIKRRQVMLVQVTKEERGTKGAALTTYLSLAGRYCVLMPNTARGGGVSRKISNPADRKRLKAILEELDIPEGMAVIIRTAGAERSKAELKRDYEYLLRLWDEIRELTLKSSAPALVYEEANLIKRSIRDLYSRDIEDIIVDGEEGYKVAKSFMRTLTPSHAKRVQLYRDPMPLLHRYQVEAQLDAIHNPVVQLKSGGYIVINSTEALVAIDVNSGRATRERNIEETAYKTNLEAAEEIARQLRLRDLAGLIVIDFIDMEESRHNAAVERRLKEAMRNDRARIQIGRISPFGLLELSRQRMRPSLFETSTEICLHCRGTGHVRSTESTVLHVLRSIEEECLKSRNAEGMSVAVPTAVALYILNHKRKTLAEIELRHGLRIFITGDDHLIPPEYRVEWLKTLAPGEQVRPPVSQAGTPQAAEEAEFEEIEEQEAEEAVEERAEAEDEANGDERRRNRRSRRRRRGRDRDEREHRDSHPPTVEPQVAADSEREPEAETGPVAEDAAEADADSADARNTEERRRRRRGRRGGRRRRRGGEAGATEAAPTDAGEIEAAAEPAATAEEEPDIAAGSEDTVPAGTSDRPWQYRSRFAERKAVGEAVEGEATAETEARPEAAAEAEPADGPETAQPAAVEPTATEIAQDFVRDEAPQHGAESSPAAPEPVEPAPAEAEEEIAPETKAEEPAPETQQQQPAPARRGWWRRLAQ